MLIVELFDFKMNAFFLFILLLLIRLPLAYFLYIFSRNISLFTILIYFYDKQDPLGFNGLSGFQKISFKVILMCVILFHCHPFCVYLVM